MARIYYNQSPIANDLPTGLGLDLVPYPDVYKTINDLKTKTENTIFNVNYRLIVADGTQLLNLGINRDIISPPKFRVESDEQGQPVLYLPLVENLSTGEMLEDIYITDFDNVYWLGHEEYPLQLTASDQLRDIIAKWWIAQEEILSNDEGCNKRLDLRKLLVTPGLLTLNVDPETQTISWVMGDFGHVFTAPLAKIYLGRDTHGLYVNSITDVTANTNWAGILDTKFELLGLKTIVINYNQSSYVLNFNNTHQGHGSLLTQWLDNITTPNTTTTTATSEDDGDDDDEPVIENRRQQLLNQQEQERLTSLDSVMWNLDPEVEANIDSVLEQILHEWQISDCEDVFSDENEDDVYEEQDGDDWYEQIGASTLSETPNHPPPGHAAQIYQYPSTVVNTSPLSSLDVYVQLELIADDELTIYFYHSSYSDTPLIKFIIALSDVSLERATIGQTYKNKAQIIMDISLTNMYDIPKYLLHPETERLRIDFQDTSLTFRGSIPRGRNIEPPIIATINKNDIPVKSAENLEVILHAHQARGQSKPVNFHLYDLNLEAQLTKDITRPLTAHLVHFLGKPQEAVFKWQQCYLRCPLTDISIQAHNSNYDYENENENKPYLELILNNTVYDLAFNVPDDYQSTDVASLLVHVPYLHILSSEDDTLAYLTPQNVPSKKTSLIFLLP